MNAKRCLIYIVLAMVLVLPICAAAQETKIPENTASVEEKNVSLSDIEKGVAELRSSQYKILVELLDYRLFSPEKIRDREALAWLIGEYMRRTRALKDWYCSDEKFELSLEVKAWQCAPRADDLFFVYGAHVFDLTNTAGKSIWNLNDEERSLGWTNFLKSQGVSEPQTKIRRTTTNDILIFVSEESAAAFYINVIRIENRPYIHLLFTRGFYCQPIVDNVHIEYARGCFLDRWRGDKEKTGRSEAERASRMIFMSGDTYKLNYLRRGKNLEIIDKCEHLLNKNASATEIEDCGETLWNYRLGEARVVYEASQKFGPACLKPNDLKACKKEENLFRPLPKELIQFLNYTTDKEKALKNYTRQMLKNAHPSEKSPDYDPQHPQENFLYDMYRGYWDGKK